MNRQIKKIKFNLVDFVIILIILAIIGAAAFLIVQERHSHINNRRMGNMSFTVRISSVEEDALTLFEKGTTVKDSVSGEVIGEIVAVNSEKTKYYGTVAKKNGDGYELPVSEYDTKYDVYVTVVASAGLDDRGIHYIGDTKILIGSTVYFKIPSFTSISYVTDFIPMIVE